jgi:hypothetical protein
VSGTSIGTLFGLTVTIVATVGNYVAVVDAQYQALLKRYAQPCPEFVVMMERWETPAAREVRAGATLPACLVEQKSSVPVDGEATQAPTGWLRFPRGCERCQPHEIGIAAGGVCDR